MIKRIAELCDEGYSRIAIGKALGLPQSTLHKLMRANNLSSHARRGVPYAPVPYVRGFCAPERALMPSAQALRMATPWGMGCYFTGQGEKHQKELNGL